MWDTFRPAGGCIEVNSKQNPKQKTNRGDAKAQCKIWNNLLRFLSHVSRAIMTSVIECAQRRIYRDDRLAVVESVPKKIPGPREHRGFSFFDIEYKKFTIPAAFFGSSQIFWLLAGKCKSRLAHCGAAHPGHPRSRNSGRGPGGDWPMCGCVCLTQVEQFFRKNH